MRHLIAIALIMLGSVAQAAPSRGDVIQFLGQLHALPFMRTHMQELGFEGENLELAMGQIERVLGDRAIAGFVADRLIAAGRGEAADPRMAVGLIEPLMDRGMSHLSPAELSYFYKVDKTVIEAMSRRDCGLAFREKLRPEVMAERTARLAARLNAPALKEYYRIQLKAARMGAKRKPKPVSAAMRARVGERLVAELTEKSAARSDGPRLIAALQALEKAGNGPACDAGRFFLNTVMSMEPKARHETLLVFSVGE